MITARRAGCADRTAARRMITVGRAADPPVIMPIVSG